MYECVFAGLDTLQFDNYPTAPIKNKAHDFVEFQLTSLYSSQLMAMNHECWVENNFRMDTGPEYLDFSCWDTCSNDSQDSVSENESSSTHSSPNDQKPTPTPCYATDLKTSNQPPSYELLQKLQEKKVNLILVATSLDEDYVLRKLERVLDAKTCRMVPLPFKDDKKNNDSNNVLKRMVDIIPEKTELECSLACDKAKRNAEGESAPAAAKSKRKRVENVKDETYWKRRNNNNEAAKKSREAKRTRFVWIEAKSKELEGENARLEEQLKAQQSRVLELEEILGSRRRSDVEL